MPLGPEFQFVAGCWWIVSGASQITIIGTNGITGARVNAGTKEIRFSFERNRPVQSEDSLLLTSDATATVGLKGALITAGGDVELSVLPLTGAVLQAGNVLVYRMLSQVAIVSSAG